MDYRACFITVITRGGYVLADMEDRIDRCWIDGKLTTEERNELLQMAAENAQDAYQVDVLAKLADLERRLFSLEHPTDIYAIWESGYQTAKGEIVRYDVTGDGQLDLCLYDGGRTSTALSPGKINGWYLLDIELNKTHEISRDADGNYVLTPVEAESE